MTSQTRILTVLSTIIAAIAIGPTALRSQEQNETTRKEQATEVKQASMTQKQREHSKLYKDYKRGENLRALAASSTGDVELVNGTPQKAFSSNAPPFNLQDFLREMGRQA